MKRSIRTWTRRLLATGLLIAVLLLVIVLSPVLGYAGQTTHGRLTVFHDRPLPPGVNERLDGATALIRESEWYRPGLRLDICLNDGSYYPGLIRGLRGRAFAWGFYDKVVLQGSANFGANYVELDGYRWNLTQLLAHEMTHCLQFDRLGL